MDFLELSSDKRLYHISFYDCVAIKDMGYDVWETVFTERKWQNIVESPLDGWMYKCKNPFAFKFFQVMINPKMNHWEKYPLIAALHKEHELIIAQERYGRLF